MFLFLCIRNGEGEVIVFSKSKNKKNIFTINKKYFQTNLLKLFEK